MIINKNIQKYGVFLGLYVFKLILSLLFKDKCLFDSKYLDL